MIDINRGTLTRVREIVRELRARTGGDLAHDESALAYLRHALFFHLGSPPCYILCDGIINRWTGTEHGDLVWVAENVLEPIELQNLDSLGPGPRNDEAFFGNGMPDDIRNKSRELDFFSLPTNLFLTIGGHPLLYIDCDADGVQHFLHLSLPPDGSYSTGRELADDQEEDIPADRYVQIGVNMTEQESTDIQLMWNEVTGSSEKVKTIAQLRAYMERGPEPEKQPEPQSSAESRPLARYTLLVNHAKYWLNLERGTLELAEGEKLPAGQGDPIYLRDYEVDPLHEAEMAWGPGPEHNIYFIDNPRERFFYIENGELRFVAEPSEQSD